MQYLLIANLADYFTCLIKLIDTYRLVGYNTLFINCFIMKKTLLILSFLSLATVLQAQTLNRKAMEKRTLEILQKYDPEALEIINTYQNAPLKYNFDGVQITLGAHTHFMEYIKGNTEENIIKHINTAVHEMNHGYTSVASYAHLQQNKKIKYNFEDEFYLYFINSKEKILVKLSPTFPSVKLARVIPKNLQTFRFSTYIKGSSSTQEHGIYGLLDEMNAYYIGTRTSFLLYDYFLNERKAEGQEWLEYMQDIDGTLYAYLEFKYYILKYLLYAQTQHAAIYQEIMQNKAFKTAFLKIDQNFGQLAADYFQRREKLLNDLQSKGFSVKIDEKYTYIGNSGTGNFMDVYHLLEEELSKQTYQEMLKILKE